MRASRPNTTTAHRLARFVVPLLALSITAAACGSDSDSTADGGSTPAPAASEQPSTDTAVAATASAGTTAAGTASGDCAVDQLPLHAPGTLTIATGEPAYEPWMVDDDPTNGKGFESAVAYALADEMGFAKDDVEWVRTDFDVAIAPGDKPYDFNMQQYSPTPEREKVVDFSVPYYTASKSVLAIDGSPAIGATTFADLDGARWGATTGTTDLDYIENEIGASDVAVFDTQADVVAAMLAGQIDATVVSLPTAFYLSSAEVENSVIVGVLPAVGEGDSADGAALLFTKGNPLVPCVDTALEALTAAGTLDDLAATWLQGSGEIPDITK